MATAPRQDAAGRSRFARAREKTPTHPVLERPELRTDRTGRSMEPVRSPTEAAQFGGGGEGSQRRQIEEHGQAG